MTESNGNTEWPTLATAIATLVPVVGPATVMGGSLGYILKKAGKETDVSERRSVREARWDFYFALILLTIQVILIWVFVY